MKMPSTRLQSSAISLIATILIGSAFAVSEPAFSEPQTKPKLTLAPYVLKDTDLRRGATSAFRPWFENGAWTGDLIEYHISEQGERCTSVSVGAFPPDDDGNSVACDYGNWSARGAFPDKIEQPDGTLADEPDAATYWQGRDLFTYQDSAVEGNKKAFWWDQLTVSQKNALDPISCGLDTNGDCVADGINQDDPEASIVLNYIRGDRSLERDKQGGIFRLRFSLLGAIINSRPAYVPTSSTDGLVFVGSNDGIIHAFDSANGSEVFGYVPSVFLPGLESLTTPGFRYFADGEIRSSRVEDESIPEDYVVAGGFGSGAKGAYALAINSATPNDPRLLFEFSGTDADHVAGMDLPYIGNIQGRPTIARLPDDDWYIVFGNGYNSGVGAGLVLVRIRDGQTSYISVDTSPDNGLSAPALVNSSTAFSGVNYAYAGDLEGNLWRFDLTVPRTASRMFNGVPSKPITVEPDIARHPTQVGVMVYFGTGQLLEDTDADTTTTQSVYGIWDETFTATNITGGPDGDLLQQSFTQETATWNETERTVRIILNEQAPDWSGDNKVLGWQVDLPNPGERLLGRPQVRAERLQLVTTNPTSDFQNMQLGDGSWFNQFSLASGASLQPSGPLYDLDRSGKLDEGDLLTLELAGGVTETFYPLGLNLGPGNIAQPAFASVLQDIDAVFINALLLPPPPEPNESVNFGGDIDVMTDSPGGPLVNPHDEESHPEYSLYGAAYPDPSSPDSPPARGPMNGRLAADGAGGNVDGHHRAYGKVHGVKYVDFFELEPRRGSFRLDAGTVYELESIVEGQTVTTKEPFIAIQELNGPTDPLPLKDGTARAPLLSNTQNFIVVLTNADLSQGTELQIGCRTWNSFDYQEMITEQLKAGTAPGALRDENGGSLVFNLSDIRSDTGCTNPTLRITVTGRVGAEDVLHGTLPGCVNNTHNYLGQRDTLGTNPHITPNQEQQGEGYRWRNGALTMQLLAVDGDGDAAKAAYELQETALPESKRVLGNGGIFAKGFSFVIDDKGKVTDELQPYKGNNGMLYEASVFWNFGDMWEFQQAGKEIACYGAPFYNAARTNEIFGLNSAQYNGLVTELRGDDNLRLNYASLLNRLANPVDENDIEDALRELARIFDTSVGEWGRHKGEDGLLLSDYHLLRSYAHGAQFQLDLLDIDQDLFQPPPPVELEVDGTPADVQDIELDLLPAAGPNYAPGRRSWIDITPN